MAKRSRHPAALVLIASAVFAGLEVVFRVQKHMTMNEAWVGMTKRLPHRRSFGNSGESLKFEVPEVARSAAVQDLSEDIDSDSGGGNELPGPFWEEITSVYSFAVYFQLEREADDTLGPLGLALDVGLKRPPMNVVRNTAIVDLALLPINFEVSDVTPSLTRLGLLHRLPRWFRKELVKNEIHLQRNGRVGGWDRDRVTAETLLKAAAIVQNKTGQAPALVVEDDKLLAAAREARRAFKAKADLAVAPASATDLAAGFSSRGVIYVPAEASWSRWATAHKNESCEVASAINSIVLPSHAEQYRARLGASTDMAVVKTVVLPASEESERIQRQLWADTIRHAIDPELNGGDDARSLQLIRDSLMDTLRTVTADADLQSRLLPVLVHASEAVSLVRNALTAHFLDGVDSLDELWQCAGETGLLEEALGRHSDLVPPEDVPRWLALAALMNSGADFEHLQVSLTTLAEAPQNLSRVDSVDASVLSARETVDVFTKGNLQLDKADTHDDGVNSNSILPDTDQITGLKTGANFASAVTTALRSAKRVADLAQSQKFQQRAKDPREVLSEDISRADTFRELLSSHPRASALQGPAQRLLDHCKVVLLEAWLEEAATTGGIPEIQSALERVEQTYPGVTVSDSALARAQGCLDKLVAAEKQEETAESEALLEACIEWKELVELKAALEDIEAKELPVNPALLVQAHALLQQERDEQEAAARAQEARWEEVEAGLKKLLAPQWLLKLEPAERRQLLVQVVIEQQCESIQQEKFLQALNKAQKKDPDAYIGFLALLRRTADEDAWAAQSAGQSALDLL